MSDLVLLGAKFSPCMRDDQKVDALRAADETDTSLYLQCASGLLILAGCCVRSRSECHNTIASDCTGSQEELSVDQLCRGSICCRVPADFPG